MSKWERQDEGRYLVSPDSDRDEVFTKPLSSTHQRIAYLCLQVDLPDRIILRSSPHSSLDDTLDSDDEIGGSESEQEHESIPASQEEADDEEGVMPSEVEGQSPIDDLKTFDWNSADTELAEFMGSDSENDSDTSSIASDSSRRSRRGLKRSHADATHGDDSDEANTLSKKRQKAIDRPTGLKTVKTPNSADSESSLPTPGVTGDEDGEEADTVVIDDGDGDDFGDLEDDLEAELEAELAAG